jgi:hypothetical protein
MLRKILVMCGLVCAIASPASAAEVSVGTGTITKIGYYSDQHVTGQAVVIEMTGTTACATRTSYGIRLDDRNQHIYSGIVSAFLAGKSLTVVVENSDTTIGSRCRIVAMTML